MALRNRAFRAVAATSKSANQTNVVGVGVDEKYVNGQPTGTRVIKFLVKRKLPANALAKKELLPASIYGFPTDVEEVGLIIPLARRKVSTRPSSGATAANPRTRIRPAQPGCSIGFKEPGNQYVMAGTFGLLVKDSHGASYILSNNHVLANESGVEADGTVREGLPVGSPIFQPGLLDGGKDPADEIARLAAWVDLRADDPDNKADAAIAKAKKSDVTRDILLIGPPNGIATALKDMIVHKFGRTTSYRVGRVSSVLFDVTINYEVGDVSFTDQIAIRGLDSKRFSDAGDSGSAILERQTNHVIGLLFAGATNGSLTFANHISDVLAPLKVKLA